jgi:hypothetical protein
MRRVLALAALPLLMTGGCVAKTAWNVATLPVKAGGKAVDMATTSSKERDEKYVREQRKAWERENKERAQHDKYCRKHPDCPPYDGYVANDPRR